MRRAMRHAPPQYPVYQQPPMQQWQEPPRPGPIDRFLSRLVGMIIIGLGLFTAYLLVTQNAALPAPARKNAVSLPSAPTDSTGSGEQAPAAPQTDEAYNATAKAQYQDAIQAQPAEQAPAQIEAPAAIDNALPTAAILIPTAVPIEQVTIVPREMPAVYAPGSDMRPTLEPTIPYPTPLPAAVASQYQLSADGTCITAPRAGKLYQVCQDWKYQPNEVASVADYIRTGLLPGVEVTQ